MLAQIKTLNNNCDRYTRLHLMFPRNRAQAGQRHEALLDSWRSKDVAATRQMLWDHIMDSGLYLRKVIANMREHRAAH